MGEKPTPNPKPEKPEPADTRTEPDPLPSLVTSEVPAFIAAGEGARCAAVTCCFQLSYPEMGKAFFRGFTNYRNLASCIPIWVLSFRVSDDVLAAKPANLYQYGTWQPLVLGSSLCAVK